MQLTHMHGVIKRRIMVNFRVDPEVTSAVLPKPFVAKVVNGFAMAGICLMRLEHIAPGFGPQWFGLSSENAAHRIAVNWIGDDGSSHEGVYIPRRDTASAVNYMAGGRIFPGELHRAKFEIRNGEREIAIDMNSRDGTTQVRFRGSRAQALSPGSVFSSVAEASEFFEAGNVGYSETAQGKHFDGLRLAARNWSVEPMAVAEVTSSFFSNLARFPMGSVELDCALLMTDIEHDWIAEPTISCSI